MLAKNTAFGNVHDQTERESHGKADLARLMYAPVQDNQRDEIRLDLKPHAGPGQKIYHQRHDER